MSGQNSIIFLVFATFFSSLMLTNTSCNRIDERYFLMLDSQDLRLEETRALLEVDFATIESRKDLIEDHLRLIQVHLKDTITADLGAQLSKYKGLKKVYQRFLSEFTNCTKETSALEKQAEDLRTAVVEREISKEEFKEFYQKEKDDALDNLNRCKKLVEPIFAVEPDYQRISRMVDETLRHMAESDSTLAKSLDIIQEHQP